MADEEVSSAEAAPVAAEPVAPAAAPIEPIPAAAVAAPVVEPKIEAEPKLIPEKYELALAADSKLDKAALGRIAGEAKDMKLSQEEAQALVQREEKAVAGVYQKQQDQLKSEVEGWVTQIQGDKEYGGEKYKETVAFAHAALNKFGTPEFSALLEKTGLGNQPDLVKLMSKVGRSMASDQAVLPRVSGADGPIRAADALFPKSSKK